MGPLVAPIVSAVAALGKQWLEGRQKKAEHKARVNEAKVIGLEKRLTGDLEHAGELDLIFVLDNGHMDEISFYTLWAAVIGVFIPWTRDHVVAGFEALETLPDEVKVALFLMLVAIWGYRRIMLPVLQAVVKRIIP